MMMILTVCPIAVEAEQLKAEEEDEDLEADMRRARLATRPMPTSQPGQPIPSAEQRSLPQNTMTSLAPAIGKEQPEASAAQKAGVSRSTGDITVKSADSTQKR